MTRIKASLPSPLFAIAFLSGLAALGHEIVWTRALVDIAGASNATFSKVIGLFFLGLSGGGWFASTWRNVRNPWRRLSLVEASIGFLSVPMLVSAPLAEAVQAPLARTILLQWILPFAAIFPPSFAMGCSLPALVAASAGRRTLLLYALNTVGGILGIILAIFVIFPKLGLRATGFGFCALNFLLACLAWPVRQENAVSRDKSVPQDRRIAWRWKVAAFISGFCILGLEVLAQHQLAQVTINSIFSSAIVLVIILFALGLGALAAALAPVPLARLAVPICLSAAALTAVEPLTFTWLRNGVTILPYELKPIAYGIEVLKLGGLAILPMFFLGGLLFPIVLKHAEHARTLGHLLALNGIGGWSGAAAFDYWFGPNLGLWTPVVCAIGAYGILAVLLAKGIRYRIVSAAISLALALIAFSHGAKLPQASLLPGEKLHSIRVNPEGVVATVESAPGDWRILFDNSYTLGGSRAQFNQERQALLPLFLHPNPKSVGILGIATGSTTAGAIVMPGVESIEAVELSSAVLAAAKEHFAPYNRNAFADARVQSKVEDARWVISCREKAYDVVLGDLFLPWRTGEGRLFTVEHFRSVRNALKTNGVFCQWLPLFQLTESQFQLILNTFTEIFPDTLLVRGDFYSDLPIVGLVANARLDNLNWSSMRQRCVQIRDRDLVKDPLLRHAEGIAMLLVGPISRTERPPRLNTLANAALELDAARNIIGLRDPWFIGVPQAQYLQHLQRIGQQSISPEFRPAHDAGQFILTMEVAARSSASYLENLKSQFSERIPRALLEDAGASWTQWPASVKLLR